MTTQNQNHSNRNGKILWGMVFFFVLVAIAVFLYWFFILRYEESTDDAYVHGNQIVVTPQVYGYVNAINVEETDIVREGAVLASLDPTDQLIALEEARHGLANTVRHVVGLFEKVSELKEELLIRETEKIKLQQDYAHRKELLEGGAVSVEQYEHAEANYFASLHALTLTVHQLQSASAMVENTTLTTHPLVEEAKDKVRKAYLNFHRCDILAASRGMIAQRQVQVGEAISPGDPLMILVPLHEIWVNANFKETQLQNVRIGQPVLMTSDLYGSSVVFHGKVEGLWPGTGSVFSVLPPQNATGNWIKIVQRLPVRISLDPEEVLKHPLRLGLSMRVTIDTHHREGEMLPIPSERTGLFQTDIYQKQLEGVEQLIAEIIQLNIPGQEMSQSHEMMERGHAE